MKFSPRHTVLQVLAALIFIVQAAQAAPAPAPPMIDANVDRPDGVYKAGEQAVFTIAATQKLPDAGVEVRYVFMRDGVTTAASGSVTVKDQPIELKQTLDKPGQISLNLSWDAPATGSSGVGAIYDPFQIQPSMDAPVDFDEFWAMQKATLAGEYQAEVTPMPAKQPGVDLFHVKIPMPDGPPVQGYMAKPHGAAPRSIGAIAFTHGAGVRSSNIPGAALGMICFDFNAHGIDDGQPADYYTKLDKGDLHDYRSRGMNSRDTIYFLGMYKRLLRAVDFLTKQPEWDGKVLAVFGGSQGGAQAIAAGALDPRVTVVVAGIPALSDLTGYRAGRISGWPKPVRLGPDRQPVDPKVEEAVRYYDSVNFARRIKCNAFFMTGLIDTTCPSCTVMPAYNSLQSETKQIIFAPKKAHSFTTERRDAERFIKEYSEKVNGKVASK